MPDRISTYKVARLSIFMPSEHGGQARYALLVNEIVRGVPRGTVHLDGVLPGSPSSPTLEEMLLLFDRVLDREMLRR